MERAPLSRSQREMWWQDGKSESWEGDRRHPGGIMTSCGRRRFWDGDRLSPGGNMKSCGSYGGYYSSRGGRVE